MAKTIKVTEIVKNLYFLRVLSLKPKFSHKISSLKLILLILFLLENYKKYNLVRMVLILSSFCY